MKNKNRILSNMQYVNWGKIIALVIKNTTLHNIMSHTRLSKDSILHHNLIIVFSLLIT